MLCSIIIYNIFLCIVLIGDNYVLIWNVFLFTVIGFKRQPKLTYVYSHLGHSEDVHKRYYHMRDSSVELVTVGKLLMESFSGQQKPKLKKGMNSEYHK